MRGRKIAAGTRLVEIRSHGRTWDVLEVHAEETPPMVLLQDVRFRSVRRRERLERILNPAWYEPIEGVANTSG